jgi:hypothetical protein
MNYNEKCSQLRDNYCNIVVLFWCVSIWNDFSTINDIVNNHSQITKKMQRKDCESVLCSYS